MCGAGAVVLQRDVRGGAPADPVRVQQLPDLRRQAGPPTAQAAQHPQQHGGPLEPRTGEAVMTVVRKMMM